MKASTKELPIRNIISDTEQLALRISLAVLSISGLVFVYIYQHFNYVALFSGAELSTNAVFIFNRISRFIINDLLAILLIWSIFRERKYVVVAFIVQAFGLFVVVPSYLILKLTLEGTSEISSPLLSFLHRVIINPIMILLLIPAFLIQKKQKIDLICF